MTDRRILAPSRAVAIAAACTGAMATPSLGDGPGGAGHARVLDVRGGQGEPVSRGARRGVPGRTPQRRHRVHLLPLGELLGEARHRRRGGGDAGPRGRLRPQLPDRGAAVAAGRRRGRGRDRPVDVQPGDHRGSRRVQLLVGGQALLPGVQPGRRGFFYNKAMFDAAGIPYPDPWPPMSVEEFADIACQLTDEDAGVWGAAVPSSVLPFETYVRSRRPDGPGLPEGAGGRPPVRGPLRHRPRRLLPDREHDRAMGRGPRLLPGSIPIDNTLAEAWSTGRTGSRAGRTSSRCSPTRGPRSSSRTSGNVRAVLRRVGLHARR